jgi:dienelactone hydrolase
MSMGDDASVSDLLAGFDRVDFDHDGITHHYYRAGAGPAVIVIHEVPGIHPGVVAFARRVIDAGFSVYLPSLFGEDGREVTGWYTTRAGLRACVSREFTVFATGRTSPIVGWLRALAARAHEECGGPGVGAVGMCFTGGFALGMMVDERMLAPVLSQPSLPFAIAARQKAAIGISPTDLVRVKQRAADGICLLGLRFTGDRFVPAERFETLRRELGDAFVAVEIDSSAGNPHGIPKDAHSVLTVHLVDEPGHPTRDALDQVLTLFRTRLTPSLEPRA